MGFGLPELIVVLIIFALVFGTKKLSNMGGDLGSAIKSFRGAMKDSEEDQTDVSEATTKNVIEGEVDIDKDDPKGTS